MKIALHRQPRRSTRSGDAAIAPRYRRLLDRSLDARVRDELDIIVDRRRSDLG